jgi:deoxyribodipyrimidine photolyase
MKVAIPRLSFRTHDNILNHDVDMICIIIDKNRLPDKSFTKSRKKYCWGFQQYNLLLQMISKYQRELRNYNIPVYLYYTDLREMSQLISEIASFAEIITDVVSDPIYADMDKMLEDQEAVFYSTFTLLDWEDQSHQTFIKQFYDKAKPFTKLTKLKQYIIDNIDQYDDVKVKKKRTINRKIFSQELMVDIEEEINNIQIQMEELGMFANDFSSVNDQYFDFAIELINSGTWTKPKTAIGIPWGKYSGKTNKDSSQLSPFISVGALSCRYFWHMLDKSKNTMGSPKDQLLFRECFNAIGIAGYYQLSEKLSDFWLDSNDSLFLDPKASQYPWKRDKKVISKWQKGDLDPVAVDTNISMKQLWEFGWIHHLQRHLVADVLTRGKLKQHWVEGMEWFRHCLIDHDSAVNRANWMWLSAVAFSSKQKLYHYNWSDYVSRGTPSNMKFLQRKYIN